MTQLAKRRKRQVDAVTRAERQKAEGHFGLWRPSSSTLPLQSAATHERCLHPCLLPFARAGLRPSEELGLQWDDLDFGAREIHIERSLSTEGEEADTKTTRVLDMVPNSLGRSRGFTQNGRLRC
jgi:hypothetical protein